jgi:opacity protein-like surface antigen
VSFNGGVPYIWLEADGRVGLVVNERVLIFGSGGIAYDTDAQAVALTGGAGAEYAVTDALSVRGQYAVQYYPSGLGSLHQGLVGLFWRLE